jgi:hypothetical protein
LAIAGTNRRAPEHFRITQYSVQYDHIHLFVEALNRQELSRGMSSVAIRIARSVNALVERRGRFWADRWYGRELTTPRQVRTALVYVLANFRKHSWRPLGPGIDPFSSGVWFDGWEGDPLGVTRSGRLGFSEERAPPSCEVVHEGIRHQVHRAIGDRQPRSAVDDMWSAGQDTREEVTQSTAHSAEREACQAAMRVRGIGLAARMVNDKPPVRRAQTWLARTGWRLLGLLRLDEAPAGAPQTA